MTHCANTSEGLGEFLARNIPGEWSERRDGPRLFCTLYRDDAGKGLAWPMARALAQYLVIDQERFWLEELLKRRYRAFSPEEQREVVDDALRLLHTDHDQDLGRLDLATTLIFSYVNEHQMVVVEGVRNFLLPEIRLEFEGAIDHAVDSYLMEQEYQEFVGLLKRLVSVAGSPHEWIHVKFSANRFYFEDAGGNRLGDDLVNEMLGGLDGEDDALDDVLISALVTLAPQRITIHQGHLGSEGLDTLRNVFDNKVLMCPGCARCYTPHVDSDRRSF